MSIAKKVALPLKVTVEVEGGCCTQVWVVDATGAPVEFEYEIDDHDTLEDENEETDTP